MNRTLTIRPRADNLAAARVLDRAGEDLARTGAVAVDQHHQRHTPGSRPMGPVAEVFLLAATLGRNDPAVGDELVGNLDSRRQQAARVAAQVDDQAPHTLAVQVPQRLLQVGGRRLLERRDLNVGHAGRRVENLHVLQTRHFHARPANGDLTRRLVRRDYRHPNHAALCAGQERRGLVGRQRLGRLAVDRRDAIAVVNARLLGRAVRNDMHDLQVALVGLQLDAEPDKVAFDLRVNIAKLIAVRNDE